MDNLLACFLTTPTFSQVFTGLGETGYLERQTLVVGPWAGGAQRQLLARDQEEKWPVRRLLLFLSSSCPDVATN